ncbi:hypothetical protein BDR26DRAFT_1008043 [Obelidium mucronatum]|nr:hypothetical protein BDR26DRAFT_1008043 [Obelidium mucronatum]
MKVTVAATVALVVSLFLTALTILSHVATIPEPHRLSWRAIYQSNESVIESVSESGVLPVKSLSPPNALNLQPNKYEKVAIVIHTGKDVYKNRVTAQLDTYLQGFKNLMIVADFQGSVGGLDIHNVVHGNSENPALSIKEKRDEGWNNDAHKFIPGLQLLYNTYPDKEWYIMIDDDTYMFLDAIMDDLNKNFDHTVPHYMGIPIHVDQKMNDVKIEKQACDHGRNLTHMDPQYAYGGSGVYVSQAAMKLFIEAAPQCLQDYRDCWAGDVRLGHCFRDAGILVNQNGALQGLNGENPITTKYEHYPCLEPKIFHHVTAEHVHALHQLAISTENANKRVTYSAVYQEFHPKNASTILYLDTRLENTRVYYQNSNQTNAECQFQCLNDPKCVSWTGEGLNCWLGDAPGSKVSASGTVSGVVGERYLC